MVSESFSIRVTFGEVSGSERELNHVAKGFETLLPLPLCSEEMTGDSGRTQLIEMLNNK